MHRDKPLGEVFGSREKVPVGKHLSSLRAETIDIR
jgi:hypothetical protein